MNWSWVGGMCACDTRGREERFAQDISGKTLRSSASFEDGGVDERIFIKWVLNM